MLSFKKKRYIYCLNDFSNPHLMFVFLILVGIFNTSQIFMRVYLYKRSKKLQSLMIVLVLMIFGFFSYKKNRREYFF